MYTGDIYLISVTIAAFANDSLVFVAISYRLAADAASAGTWRCRVLSVIRGEGLYSLSRTLMKSGQLFYL